MRSTAALEKLGDGPRVRAGFFVYFAERGCQQGERPRNGGELSELSLGAHDLAVDALVVPIELPSVFQQGERHFLIDIAVCSDQGAERIQNVASCCLTEWFDPGDE